MDGLEERVRRALGAGALAADPSLVDVDAVHAGIAARRRRRLALVSTVGVMALLGTGAAVAFSQNREGRNNSVTTEPGPTSGDRVPWLAIPPPTQSSGEPTPSPLPTARDCRHDDLEFVRMDQEGAAGTIYNFVVVRNISTTPCTLSLKPGHEITASQVDGASIEYEASLAAGGVRPATLAPGESGRAPYATSDNCPSPSVTYTIEYVYTKDGRGVRVGKSVESTCGLRFGNWYLEAAPDDGSHYPDLAATIEGAPLNLEPGTTLDYTVALSNEGATEVRLPSPCPGYREYVTDGTHTTDVSYGLNCAGWDGVIPAGGTVRLQMKLDIPAGLTTPVKLFWVLESEADRLVLTADGLNPTEKPQPAPQPVNTTSAAPGPTAQVTLYHCGINPVTYDGATWEVTHPQFDATNAPADFTGFGQFVREGQVLHFTDKAGATIDFTLDDGVAPTALCA